MLFRSPKLEKLGIKTIGDLAHYDLEKLTKYFKNQAIYLNRIARGIDNSEVISEVVDPTSIGNEITLTHDATDYNELCKYLLAISDSVALRLRKQNKYANVIVVVLKDNFFKRKSHQNQCDPHAGQGESPLCTPQLGTGNRTAHRRRTGGGTGTESGTGIQNAGHRRTEPGVLCVRDPCG